MAPPRDQEELLREEMLAAAPVDFEDPAVQASMLSQLLAGEEGSVSCSEIIPRLHLGRARDTEDAGYGLVVCATNGARELHASLRGLPRRQLPIIAGGRDVSADAGAHAGRDVGPESFAWEGQEPLRRALSSMDEVLRAGGRVLVCCQQGKDRSALVVLAYLRARFGVPPEHLDNLYNFVQSRRCSVTSREIPRLWSFIRDTFDADRARGALAAAGRCSVTSREIPQLGSFIKDTLDDADRAQRVLAAA